jgi:hypothetical protein
MPTRPTAQERLERTRKLAKEQAGKMQQRIRVEEAAANEEARKERTKHLWALAKLIEKTGLSSYSTETLTPHFTQLAATLTSGAEDGVAHRCDGGFPA